MSAADEIRALLETATSGPWQIVKTDRMFGDFLVGPDPHRIIVADPFGSNPQDAALIAAAPGIARWALELAEAAEAVLPWGNPVLPHASRLRAALNAPLRAPEPAVE